MARIKQIPLWLRVFESNIKIKLKTIPLPLNYIISTFTLTQLSWFSKDANIASND